MKPRILFISLAATLVTALTLIACGSSGAKPQGFPIPEPDYNAKLQLDFSSFEEAMATLTDTRRAELDHFLSTATIADIGSQMETGQISSEELTIYYLDRIKRYDVNNFNSVMRLNPNALNDARALDAENAAGKNRGLMHGLPVLVKDNVAVAGIPAAAGAVAMNEWIPDRDAPVVTALRDSGAVILGKANLSEWANWMDKDMPDGFSALGGQTRNPYGPFDTLGSSSGSAVAAAANFAVVTVGTETQGSLLAPASNNSTVGIKPTHTLVSGDYIIPLMPFQDTAGPMARHVIDAAILLTAMTGNKVDYTQNIINAQNGNGLRVGMIAEMDELKQRLEALGYEVVMIDRNDYPKGDAEVFALLPPTFKYALNDFLPAVNAPVSSLEEIIAFNKEDMKNRAPYGQGYLEESQKANWSKEETEQKIQERIQKKNELLTTLFDKYKVDVIIDNAQTQGAPLSQSYAGAGWPAMVIPLGYDAQNGGIPVSMSFVARPNKDGEMIATAFIVEQAIQAWQPPDLDATIQMLDEKLDGKK